MKVYIKYLMLTILAMYMVNCDDNLEDFSSDFSAGLVITPDQAILDDDEDTLLLITPNYFIPLADVSQNSVGREWTISEGGHFLNDEFSILDDGGDFTRFIDSTAGLVSNNDIIHVLFTEVGFHTIDFEGRFADSTSFRLETPTTPVNSQDFVPTVFDDDLQLWTVNRRFHFAVVQEELTPTLSVENPVEGTTVLADSLFVSPISEFNNNLNNVSAVNRSVDVESGGRLIFSDLTSGIPNLGTGQRIFLNFDPDLAISNPGVLQTILDTFCNSDIPIGDIEDLILDELPLINADIIPSNSGTVDIEFTDVNTDRMVAFIQRRNNTGGDNGPNIFACFPTIIPRRINVIPSSLPFIINPTGSDVGDGNMSLEISVSGALNNLPVDQAGNFRVFVTNPNGFSGTNTVVSAIINPTNPSSIVLELSDPVFELDEITVEYNNSASSSITSVDSRMLEDTIGPITVSNPLNGGDLLVNLLSEDRSGVEVEQAANANQVDAQGFFSQGNNGRTPTTWLRSTARSNSGEASVRFETAAVAPPGGGIPGRFPLQTRLAAAVIPPGSYRINFSIFIESGTGLAEISTAFNSSGITIDYDISSIPRNEWVELVGFLTTTADITTGGNSGRIDFVVEPAENTTVTGPVVFFIDDIQLASVNAIRPTP